ncbi:MAG TPA: hypothetical protein VFH89_01480 [Sphingomicrobium sp.]|nr:hypothetical protein [Sphingomicrobium sp.]
MNLFWDLYWPAISAAVVIGVLSGRFAYRLPKSGPSPGYRRRRLATVVIAGAATLLAAWIWHGPVGTGDRFATTVERQARQVLVDFEMEPVHAVVVRGPLRRSLVLSGPADDFQRSELVRILNDVAGVGEVHWTETHGGFILPLVAEVELAALISFGLGLLLAYLLELRRRYNAQWSW